MTIITNSSVRLAALVAGVAVAVGLMASVAVAPAQAAGLTAVQVQAIVQLLQSFGADSATIANVTAALNGQATSGSGSGSGTGGACPVLTRSLSQGMTGADVQSLQVFLNASAATRVSVSGAGSPGLETTYFGPATHSAVVKFQAANSVSPIGIVGPATRAAIAAVCGNTTPGPVTPGPTSPLQGGEGQLSDIDNISNDVENEVDEDQTENVFGIEVTAEDSDVMIERVDVDFVLDDNANGSDNLDDYITEVSLMLDGKELASMDVDEADENDAGDGDFSDTADTADNDYYSFRFSGLKGIVREDDTARLYVAVTAVDNVDADDAGDSWHVNIPDDGIRAIDAAGISDTYVDDLTDEEFSVVEPDAGDLDLSASTSDNEDRVISVSAESDTTDEEVMIFTLESNTGDNNVSEITVNFATSSATTTSFTDVINQVCLFQGSSELGCEDITATSTGGGTANFDDLDLDIDEDEEVEFTVKVDFNDEADEREGFQFRAYVQGSGVEAEDSEGDDVTVSGTVSGGDIELRTEGITADFKSADANRTNATLAGQPDEVEYILKFSVTNNGDDDVYLDGDSVIAASPVSGTDGLAWATTTDSSDFASTSATGLLSADDGTDSDDVTTSGAKSFLIESDETRNFTFRVTVQAGTDNTNLGVRITGLKWDTNSDDTHANLYNFDMSDWKTDTVVGLMVR